MLYVCHMIYQDKTRWMVLAMVLARYWSHLEHLIVKKFCFLHFSYIHIHVFMFLFLSWFGTCNCSALCLHCHHIYRQSVGIHPEWAQLDGIVLKILSYWNVILRKFNCHFEHTGMSQWQYCHSEYTALLKILTSILKLLSYWTYWHVMLNTLSCWR